MGSFDQYITSTDGSDQQQTSPNLLPSEFQYPTQTTGNGGYTTDTSGGIVQNNSGVVDASGQYVVDNGGQYTQWTPQSTMPSPEQVYGQSQIDAGQAVPYDGGQGYQTGPGTQWQPAADQMPQTQVPMDQGQGQAPVMPQDTSNATSNSSSDVTGGTGGGGGSTAWWLADRGLSLGATALAANKFIPNLQAFMPEGAKALPLIGEVPTWQSFKSIPKDEWMNAAKTDLGKAMGGAYVADTLLDQTLLKGRDTSWKTLLVDVATPFAINHFLPGMGLGKTLGLSVAAHIGEKMLFEDKKE